MLKKLKINYQIIKPEATQNLQVYPTIYVSTTHAVEHFSFLVSYCDARKTIFLSLLIVFVASWVAEADHKKWKNYISCIFTSPNPFFQLSCCRCLEFWLSQKIKLFDFARLLSQFFIHPQLTEIFLFAVVDWIVSVEKALLSLKKLFMKSTKKSIHRWVENSQDFFRFLNSVVKRGMNEM